MTRRPLWFLALVPLALGGVACESDAQDEGADAMAGSEEDGGGSRVCEGEARDDFAIGVQRAGTLVDVAVMDAAPADPVRGDNDWTLRVTDPTGNVAGATLSVQPWMPDHGHGTPVRTTITDMGDGEYNLTPLNLFMAGLWEIRLELELADGTADAVVFHACVD